MTRRGVDTSESFRLGCSAPALRTTQLYLPRAGLAGAIPPKSASLSTPAACGAYAAPSPGSPTRMQYCGKRTALPARLTGTGKPATAKPLHDHRQVVCRLTRAVRGRIGRGIDIPIAPDITAARVTG